MFRKIIKTCLVFVIFFYSSVSADIVICDSGNINLTGDTLSDICNGGYENFNISTIKSFTGNYINYDLGYWGNTLNNDLNSDVDGKLPIGYFNGVKKTKVKKVNPISDSFVGYIGTKNFFVTPIVDLENNYVVGFFDKNKETNILNTNLNFTFPVGYIGTKKNFVTPIVDLENNYVVGFFDKNKETIILNTNSDFIFPVGYLGNHKLKKKSSGGAVIINNEITYEKFFKEIFRKNTDPNYLKKYSNYELEKFIDKIVDFLLITEQDSQKIILEVNKKRIERHIKNTDFEKKVNNLIENLDEINKAFESIKKRNDRIYVLDYFVSKD